MTAREKTREIAIALARLDEEQQPAVRVAFEVDLGADQGAHTGCPRGLVEAGRAVEPAAVGESEDRVAELGRAIDQVLGVGGAFEEGEGAPAAQLDVVRSGGHGVIFVFFSPPVNRGGGI